MNYDIRQSQVIHTWPAGAMIDFPEISLIMLCHDDAPNDWGLNINSGQENPNKKTIIMDNRLAEAFKVDHFVVPPSLDGINNLTAWSVRFPRAQYCPKCGLIHMINREMGRQLRPHANTLYDQSMSPFYCSSCFDNQKSTGPKLVPMRFVIATEEGFLDDFPWDWYVHKNLPQEINKGHKLIYKSEGGSASLSDIKIESYRVKDNSFVSRIDLGKIFDQEIFTERYPIYGNYLDYVKGFMPKPWKGWLNNSTFVNELISDIPEQNKIMDGENLSPIAKRKFPRTIQRGAGNIIFPIIYSGILLPQSTYEQQCPQDIQLIIDNYIIAYKDMSSDYNNYSNDDWCEFFIKQVKKNPTHGLNKQGYQPSETINFIIYHFGENSSEQFLNKAILLRRQEFIAFTGNVSEDEKIWFKKKSILGSEYNSLFLLGNLFDEVILLEKLSALKVFKGFTRVKPLMSEELIFADSKDNFEDDFLSLEFNRIQEARKNPIHTRDLPAVEVRGEGIFLKFNNKRLNDWAETFPDSRINTINTNLIQANITFNQNQQLINKRYLFLHSFSHILLKELAEDCGYSLSSLSEIIYCSTNAEVSTSEEMNGILIYTTTSDSEGSLGGLVEKGNPKYFSSVIKKGVDKSRWCSSDPLCITTDQGQGFMGLNLAACYSCVLLPETSCEKMNKYLDRATIIGTLQNESIGLFNTVNL